MCVCGGGGGGGRRDVPLFLGQFFRATIFLCRFFFNSSMPFLGRFTNKKQFLNLGDQT